MVRCIPYVHIGRSPLSLVRMHTLFTEPPFPLSPLPPLCLRTMWLSPIFSLSLVLRKLEPFLHLIFCVIVICCLFAFYKAAVRQSTSYRLRNTSTDLRLPKIGTANGKKSFSFRGAKLWNSLLANCKQAASLSTFKQHI